MESRDAKGALVLAIYDEGSRPTSSFKILDRMGLALKPKWNKMIDIAKWEIPAGQTIYKGKAAMQFPWIGGKTQYYVPFSVLDVSKRVY